MLDHMLTTWTLPDLQMEDKECKSNREGRDNVNLLWIQLHGSQLPSIRSCYFQVQKMSDVHLLGSPVHTSFNRETSNVPGRTLQSATNPLIVLTIKQPMWG